MRTYKRRDLLVVELTGDGLNLVIGCDSCGAIGEKAGDMLVCPPEVVGAYTARVAIMEVMSSGARLVSVADNVCNEMRGVGDRIQAGVLGELAKLGLDGTVLTGSTEENFATCMTGLGVTAVGAAGPGRLRFAREGARGAVILLGKPKMGAEVVQAADDPDIVRYEDIVRLTGDDEVLEVVPVGSKGIGYECEHLARLLNGTFSPCESGVDMYESAGPATCAVALVSESKAKAEVRNNGFVIVGQI